MRWIVTIFAAVSMSAGAQPFTAHFANAGSAYGMIAHLALKTRLAHCREYSKVGNESLAASCRSIQLNAYDYLLRLSADSPIPGSGWNVCQRELANDLDLAARCIVAAAQICKFTPDGKMVDVAECYRIMLGNTWIENPAAAGLNFSYPTRTDQLP